MHVHATCSQWHIVLTAIALTQALHILRSRAVKYVIEWVVSGEN